MSENWHSRFSGSSDRMTWEDGLLDEVSGRRGAHLERMSGNQWFLIIQHDDGSETALWFDSKNLGKHFERREPRP